MEQKMEHMAIQVEATKFVVVHYDALASSIFPWKDATFDAFIAIVEPELLTESVAIGLSELLVRLHTDWIETMGNCAESLHDCIDSASVRAGRQPKIGDGSPMTAWHEELVTINEMVNYLVLGGLGASESKVVVLVGSSDKMLGFCSMLAERTRL